MLDRIQLLRNIGQFDSADAGARIPLARLTIIYSENGRGKTTLAAVLRSLATGDPIPIVERRRLASQHPPHVVLECGGGLPPAIFERNHWSRTLTDLVVFDDVFVDQNVHSGLAVQAHHRQNLHELILGARAVALSRESQQLLETIERHNRDLRAKESAIPAATRVPFSVEDFCALPNRADIDRTILEAERALAAAREQDAIRTTPGFESVTLPTIDLVAIERILGEDLPALDTATQTRIQEHLARLGRGGEGWAAEGMRRVDHGDGAPCPFCAQDLRGSPIIRHYQAYFSAAYTALKHAVSETLGAVRSGHGGEAPAGFERAVRIAVERRQFWSRFCEVADFTIDTASIVRDWSAARDMVVTALADKQAAPLERMRLSDELYALVAAYEAHRATIAGFNELLREANQAIAVARERAGVADSEVIARDLVRLKAIKARHSPEVGPLCAEYLLERVAKEATVVRRDHVKAELEQHRAVTFPGYQAAINIYLQNFSAGFRLDSVAYADTRGGPTCTYNVVINATQVAVGGADPAPGQPSFRNTLSAGDRSTLALAFFFASLDHDPMLANKVVVIDDPVSSLDDHRTLTTAQEIRRLAEQVSQVIVLSHDRRFLCSLWERADARARAAVEVVREGAGSTLRAWNVEEDLKTEHDKRHLMLRDYLSRGAGDLREVARNIRPHLETFLRVARPEQFLPGTLLGDFIEVCRRHVGTGQEIFDKASIRDLQDLNEYARRYHHQGWETEPINDGQLRGFVDKALKFTRR